MDAPSTTSTPHKVMASQVSPPKPMSTGEHLKLQQECFNHKLNAMKLRREGKAEEADTELNPKKCIKEPLTVFGEDFMNGVQLRGLSLMNERSIKKLTYNYAKYFKEIQCPTSETRCM
ncbi:unnamed protein product [Amaranthus hypochondriacus]